MVNFVFVVSSVCGKLCLLSSSLPTRQRKKLKDMLISECSESQLLEIFKNAFAVDDCLSPDYFCCR